MNRLFDVGSAAPSLALRASVVPSLARRANIGAYKPEASARERRQHARFSIRRAAWLVAALSLFALGGCARNDSDGDSLPSGYGENSGERFSASVNGLTVLADMCTAAGDTVRERKQLSTVLTQDADAIIWAPDDFNPPDSATCAQIDGWLRSKENRTFVYIGHDFDARPDYWRQILDQTPAGPERDKYEKELSEALGQQTFDRVRRPETASCQWFALDSTLPTKFVHALSGDWSGGIDAAKARIELNSRMIATDEADVLLADDDAKMIVGRQTLDCIEPKAGSEPGTSTLLLVVNGSFLFNVPLVNHEHRKLAGRLIEAIGKSKEVVILDSQNHHPVLFGNGNGSSNGKNDNDNSPDQPPQSMLDIFNVWPLSAILVQWGILIVALCFAKWPIFGPPRDPPPPPISDFGRHVDALGAAMAVTGDAEFAHSRVQQYRQVRDATGPRDQPHEREEAELTTKNLTTEHTEYTEKNAGDAWRLRESTCDSSLGFFVLRIRVFRVFRG